MFCINEEKPMARKIWIHDPHFGGKKIPETVAYIIRKRILDHAAKHYAGKYNRIDVRFHGHFCYIDAYIEPYIPEDYDPEIAGVSREEYIERLRTIPTHLCRLRYFGDENQLSIAFYTYSNEKYEPCLFSDGSWYGTPEEAFDISSIYLIE